MNWTSETWAIRCVWLRYFDVFRKDLAYALVTTFVEPILMLLSFGFGLGSIVGELSIDGRMVGYRPFIMGGIVAQAVMFQAFFDGAYGSFIRMYYQRIFKSMALTPITLGEVLWGELLWDASKATFSSASVLLIGALIGDFSVEGALLCIPICFMSALMFASLGLWVAAKSKTIESISYPQYLVIMPMFLFCGLFYPLTTLPQPLYAVAWALPLTSVQSLVRTLVLGFKFEWWSVPILCTWLIGFVWLSRRAMTARLIK